jgi:hypothetical protein
MLSNSLLIAPTTAMSIVGNSAISASLLFHQQR